MDRSACEVESDPHSIVAGMLREVDANAGVRQLARVAIESLRHLSGCDAGAIRMRDGDDFPFVETQGFPARLVNLESSLCSKSTDGSFELGLDGCPVVHCLCGAVALGKFDGAQPFFTPRGSFWTGDAPELIGGATLIDPPARLRGRCIEDGFRSLALVPVRNGGGIVGVFMLGDKQAGRITEASVGVVERVVEALGPHLAERRTFDALRDSEHRYRALFDNMMEGFVYFQMIFDEQGMPVDALCLSANDSFRKLTGLTDVVGKRVREVMPDFLEDAPDLVEWCGRVCATGTPERFEVYFRPLERWLQMAAYSPEDGHLVAVFEDITERKLLEQSLRLTQLSLDRAKEPAMWVAPEGGILYANDSLCERLGHTRDEVLGLKIWDVDGLLTEEDWPATWEGFVSDGSSVLESLYLADDGELFPVELSRTHVRESSAEHALVFVRDVTERKRAELALLESSELFRQAFHATPVGVALCRMADGFYYDINESYEKILGYARDELVGRANIDSGIFPDAAFRKELLQEIQVKGGIQNREVVLTAKSGEPRHILLTSQSVERDNERCVLSFFTDITERVRSEQALHDQREQFRQAQKMEAIGQLAGGIAHDFNNVLTAIIGYSDLILGSAGSASSAVQDDVREIKAAAERASRLTRQILAFSRRQTLRPELVSLNQLLINMDRLLGRTLGAHIEMISLLKSNLGLVEVDVTQFEQVILNLAVNARDAMPGGGKLTLETANVDLGPEFCRAHGDLTPGAHVMLAVSDTGEGMDQETKSHIFEPFFTTKPAGQGTGLGLATVYGIVKQSGGSIFVHSKPDQGTSIKIYLPRVDRPPQPQRSQPEEPQTVRGHESILVLEDEEPVRTLVTRILTGQGYKVTPASFGREAVTLLEAKDLHFDLLLSDLILPGELQGHQVAREAERLRPGLPVLFMSGYSRDAVMHAGRLDEGVNYLEKPFTPDILTKRVREVLDRRGLTQ